LDSWTDAERQKSKELLKQECNHILSELDRLEMRRCILDMRLANVLSLVSCRYSAGPLIEKVVDCG
jgi:hypothetical protein